MEMISLKSPREIERMRRAGGDLDEARGLRAHLPAGIGGGAVPVVAVQEGPHVDARGPACSRV